MARVSTYLNFSGSTEEAFNFYKSVFGGEFEGEISRFKDIPSENNETSIPEGEEDLVMHVALPILGGHVLMGTDVTESMGFKVKFGNNVFINLEPDTKEETDRLFSALSDKGKIDMELQDMFWGGYYGSCTDKFGIHWMFNFQSE